MRSFMSHEFEDIEDPDVVLQGDVIEWLGEWRQPPWQAYGVIVTADCDLHWEKHGGHISYVPAMNTEDYLWYQWRQSILAGPCSQQIRTLSLRINRWLIKNRPEYERLSEGAICSWLARVGKETFLSELGVTDNGQRKDIGAIIDGVETLSATLELKEADLDVLIRAYGLVNPKAASDRSVISKAFQASLGSLPGDVFHLPVLPNDEDDGLFLMLRHIRQCAAAAIAKRPDDIRFGEARAKRAVRVSAPFRYAITQALSRVFGDIGLPLDHETRRSTAADRYFTSRNLL